MTDNNVLNTFQQPGPDGDNKLMIDGTSQFKTGEKGTMVTKNGQDIATHIINITVPDISTGSTQFVFPGLLGGLIAIHAATQGVVSSTAVISFAKYTGTGGTPVPITGSSISIVAAVAGAVYDKFPSGLSRNFGTADGLEIKCDGNGAGAVAVVLTFDFLTF